MSQLGTNNSTPDVEDRQNMHPPRLSRQSARTARACRREFAALVIRAPGALLLVRIRTPSLTFGRYLAPRDESAEVHRRYWTAVSRSCVADR